MNRLTALALTCVFLGGMVFTGCSHRLGDFSIVSTKNYERNIEYRNLGRFEGSDMVPIVLGFQFGVPTFEDAVDDALENGGGVYLANAVIRSSYWFVILYGQNGYKVEGDVYAPVGVGDVPAEGEEYETYTLIDTENGPVMQSTTTGDQIPVEELGDVMAKAKSLQDGTEGD